MKRTVSGMVGKGSLTHNNRDFIAKNIDRTRTADNITYLNEDLRRVYDELFSAALGRYNAKQKRSDRKIADYYEHIRTGKQEKLFHEVIFQIGNVKNTAVGTPEGEQAKAVLDEFMKNFQKRNPNLRVFSAHLHMDEATPHLHIDFVPFTTDSKRGLDTRVSMKKALATQGYEGGSRSNTEFNQWINSEKQALAHVMERHGIEWEKLGTHNEHLSVLEYKKKERTAEIYELEQSIQNLRQKKLDIKLLENIETQKMPLTSKILIHQKDYSRLLTAAEKYLVQIKKESQLMQRLNNSNEINSQLQRKIVELEKELTNYRSIQSRFSRAALEAENANLRKQNTKLINILEQHGFTNSPEQVEKKHTQIRN